MFEKKYSSSSSWLFRYMIAWFLRLFWTMGFSFFPHVQSPAFVATGAGQFSEALPGHFQQRSSDYYWHGAGLYVWLHFRLEFTARGCFWHNDTGFGGRVSAIVFNFPRESVWCYHSIRTVARSIDRVIDWLIDWLIAGVFKASTPPSLPTDKRALARLTRYVLDFFSYHLFEFTSILKGDYLRWERGLTFPSRSKISGSCRERCSTSSTRCRRSTRIAWKRSIRRPSLTFWCNS